MGMPASTDRHWTPADLEQFPEKDGNKYECIDGVLFVTPTPRVVHQLAVNDLCAAFAAVVGTRRALELAADLRLTADSLVQPDVFVLPTPLTGQSRWADVPRPLVVIEVLSPSTASSDRGRKRRLYQRAGVPEYWIVDLDTRCIERWTAGATEADIRLDQLTWTDPVSGAMVTIVLPAFFATVWGATAPEA